jgi:type IV pilus assembly protein PilQ
MRILLRVTFLSLFAVIGLALAVSVAMHATTESLASTAPVTSTAPQTASIRLEPLESVERSAPTVPSPHVVSPGASREEVRDILDESISRWTASYFPAMTRQFELLEQAQESAKKLQEQAQETAQQIEKVQTEIPQGSEELPPNIVRSNARSIGPGTMGAVAPEVQRNAEQDLVSVTAPNSDIREVLKILSDATGMNILATPSVVGSVSISLTDVALEDALAAILKSSGFSTQREKNFIYVGTVEEIQNLATANDTVGTRVYRPNYVAAAELQKLLTPMLSKDVGMISLSTAAEVGIASNKDKAGGDAYAGSDVLLVRDFDTVLCQLDQVFEEVDRMPAQVAIETMILSVRLDDQNTLGVDFELLRNKDNIRIVSGGTTDSLANLNFADGLKVGFLDQSLFAFIDAVETIGDTNVIASPHVMCLNKQRAEILIGSELGYVSTTVTETAATQTVEFLEVGTHLKIRPFISSDGMVRMEVHPELSTGTVRVQQGFTLPDKDVTQVTTNIMCRSGATLIIGGLIREDLVTSSTQIPVLGNLPLVGALFRQRSEDTERREIIVLLTPRIIGEPEMYEEAAHAATQSRDRRNAFYDKMQPTNKRRIGERYHRLAVAAWTASDADMALRYANLAIHYDPLLQSSIDLRQEILAFNPALERGVDGHLRYGLRPWEHPLHDYSAETGWPWRENAPVQPPSGYVAPMDTGHSGVVRSIVTDRERGTVRKGPPAEVVTPK